MPSGMLHRAKYSRFRNDSLSSPEERPGGKNSSDSPPHMSPHLSSFNRRMAHLKLSGPAGFLALSSAPRASRDLPRRTVASSARTLSSSSALRLTSCLSLPCQPECDVQVTPSTMQIAEGVRNRAKAGLGDLDSGACYTVKYMGCVEVLRSMRSLDFNTRTQVTREAISRVCEADPNAKAAMRKRKPPNKELSPILGKRNLQFAGMKTLMCISTANLSLMIPDSKQVIIDHHMHSVSFASGGDPDTRNYVAYVAKDPVNQRACHILECFDGLAQCVINSIGQAFELRFKQYLKNPHTVIKTNNERTAGLAVWNVGNENWKHGYCNELPGKLASAAGLQNTRVDEDLAIQNNSIQMIQDGNLSQTTKPPSVSSYENYSIPHKQTFTVPELTEVVQDRPVVVPITTTLSSMRLQFMTEIWYCGRMSRQEAERLLINDGDFLVRESNATAGQYVLTGLQGGQAKHLLLVDPEGMVRTKDHIFDSISHLISYHVDNQLPIISSGSELYLKKPIWKDMELRMKRI
ncbi:SHC-transforming protein 1-like isoform X2 [Narcine bancroftii]|uniref:SHC-transforming protein 1-like isoform X2 n=1 Tax=Narcine bancroftii TaxID=1343680 RepID=UPI0038318E49